MSKFEVISGVEGCCLALDDTRIAGPKPWGGGTVIHAWETNKEYKAVETCERVRDDVSGLDVPHNGWYVCSKCGEPMPIMNRYCGGCGAIVRKVGA